MMNRTKHPHAELMALYAQDAMETNKPWERWEYRDAPEDGWYSCVKPPQWAASVQYRRKTRTIRINGFDVPECRG